jgi:hypothetical protein
MRNVLLWKKAIIGIVHTDAMIPSAVKDARRNEDRHYFKGGNEAESSCLPFTYLMRFIKPVKVLKKVPAKVRPLLATIVSIIPI